MIGKSFGPYEITAKLGEGGMGEVYRASDSRLKRAVALKVLSPAHSWDQDRLLRFEREAQLLAQLHHPNIATLYGLEESDGVRAIVMELVDGDDLSALIDRGPLPLADAISIARQVADALDAAHEHGIIHRDLKPANIKIDARGTAKVLDFGLAKAMDPAVATSTEVMNSPTLTARATGLGIVLGTAAYMAPEQAKGKLVDRRADIWAFGVVLFEMLTGRRTFPGEDISEIVAAVLKSEPDWHALPLETPPSVLRLLRRCLEKDPRRRLSSIADARLELRDEELAVTAPDGARPVARRPLVLIAGSALAGVVVAALLAVLFWPSARPLTSALMRLSIPDPVGVAATPDSGCVVISPDGRQVVFMADLAGATLLEHSQLWVRPLDSLASRHLEGTEGAQLPFWSPDSQSVAFYAGGKLKKINLLSNRVEVLCDMVDTRGGAWSPAGVILFAPDANGPLYRVSANGGDPVQVTTLDPARQQRSHRFPTFLPDGEHFLYATLPSRNGAFDIFAGSLHSPARTFVATMDSSPVYVHPGWLLFSRHGALAAQRFDTRTLRLSGEPIGLDDEPEAILDATLSYTAEHSASVSADGTLAYYSSHGNKTKAVILDASGKPERSISLPTGRYSEVVVSPRGNEAAVVRSLSTTESQIWLLDLDRGSTTALSRGRGLTGHPVWSPDGTRIVFSSDREGTDNLFVKVVADPAPEKPFFRSSSPFKAAYCWSADGKWIVIGQLDPVTLQNIYLLPTTGRLALQPYFVGPGRDYPNSLSPDGRWLTYSTENGGDWELVAQSFPVPDHKTRVAVGSVLRSWWTPDARHILYLDGPNSSIMVADLETTAPLRIGNPRLSAKLPPGIIALDATPDRRQWIALLSETGQIGSLTVVLNELAHLPK